MQTKNFVALYRGETVADARLIAVSSDSAIVGRFIRELAGEDEKLEEPEEPRKAVPLSVVKDDEV